jgi:hypothetical protein
MPIMDVPAKGPRALRKFKRCGAHLTQAHSFIKQVARDKVDLFTHWQLVANSSFV